jgi:hypothetical protein
VEIRASHVTDKRVADRIRQDLNSGDRLPKRGGERLLQLLVHIRDQEAVAGDRLEEYRASVVPAQGLRADLWYLRQVWWYLLRHVGLPAFLVAASLIVRYLFDTLAPVAYTPGVVHARSAIMSWTLMLIFALAGARTVWRTGRITSGVVVALVSAVLGGIGSVAGTVGMLAIWHDPATLHAWQASGGLDEALWGVPVILIPIGLVTGTIGATVARMLLRPFSARHVR